MPRLIVRATPLHGDSVVELSRLRTTIGRSARNDLCVEDPFASRLHAEVRRRGDSYWISDLGSANGTQVNGKRLHESTPLRDRDLIRIGETEIEYTEHLDTAPARRKTNLLFTDDPSQGRQSWGEMTIGPGANSSAAEIISTLGRDSGAAAAPKPARDPALQIEDDTLSLITRVSLSLLSPLSLEETFRQVLDSVFEVVPADRGYVMLFEGATVSTDSLGETKTVESGTDLVCKASRYRDGVVSEVTDEIQISQSISEQVLQNAVSVLTSDARHDPRFHSRQSIVLGETRSVMAVPLMIEKRIGGMIYVESRVEANHFTERDLKLLSLIAGVAAIRIENMSLLELREEQRRLANELEVASEIQLGLHPSGPPTIAGYDLDGYSFPCYEVGGDYYDFIPRSDGRHVVALGDVSGKGTGAALLMSSIHAAVRANTRTHLSACEVVTEINNYICDNSPANRYVTLFYSEIDPDTHRMTYINAGHNPPILVRTSGGLQRLDIGGLPVGITPLAAYTQGEVTLGSGDVLVIFSDGVTDSLSESGEDFGETRLISAISENRHRTAAGIRDRIDEALGRFVGKASSVDDLTVVIVKRQE
ncbi:MAG: FHA domain-containing protein [Acidobacteria bacterium]|nr:FHA domain-containing protein [Acidobacteriota bacterium]